MYTLFHDKNKLEIKVNKAARVMQNAESYSEDVTRYNNSYYICLKRKPLVDKAKEIKQEWVTEAEEYLERVNNIKI